MRRIIFLVSIIFIPKLLSAQLLYTGDYTFNGLEGEGIFEFIEGKEGEVIKHGNFQFFRKQIDSADNNVFYRTEVIGEYLKDKKSGIWDYEDEMHTVVLIDVDDFKVLTDLTSEQIKLRAEYAEGRPNGRWTFIQNEFVDGQLKPKAEADRIIFKNGVIEGRFQYKDFKGNKTHFIRGEVLEGGLMNGEWILVYEEDKILVSEVRNYEQGFLLGLVKRNLDNDEVLEEIVFFKTIEKLSKTNNKENDGFRIADDKFGLTFNDGFLEDFEEISAQREGNRFISSFLRNVMRYDESFVNAEGVLIDYPIHTKRFVFEIKRDDQIPLVEIPRKFSEMKGIVEEYASKNALNINRSKSDSLAFAHSFFQFYKAKLGKFEELMTMLDSKEIQYFDLRYLAEKKLPFVTEEDVITYGFEEEKKEKSINYEVRDIEENFFDFLNTYVDQMAAEVNQRKEVVDRALYRIEQDEGLRVLEGDIQKQKETLDQVYLDMEGLSDREIELIIAVQENILEKAYNTLAESYAQEEDFEQKRQTGQVILDLFSEMNLQYGPLSKVFELNAKLDELYMEETFNPFTYTRYDQRVKERLFEAGQRLFEHYVNRIKSESDYTEIKNWINKIENLNVRMVELLEEDTRRLERRLNRRESINRIESLLNL